MKNAKVPIGPRGRHCVCIGMSDAPLPLTPRGESSLPASSAAVGATTAVSDSAKVLCEFACELVTQTRIVVGTLQLMPSRLCFHPDLEKAERQAEELSKWEETKRGERPMDKPPREKEWLLSGLHEVHRRRYLLRASAVELFFRDSTAVFLNLREELCGADCSPSCGTLAQERRSSRPPMESLSRNCVAAAAAADIQLRVPHAAQHSPGARSMILINIQSSLGCWPTSSAFESGRPWCVP